MPRPNGPSSGESRPSNLTAYDIYLLGMEAKHGGAAGSVTKEGLDEAERLFRNALEIDPQLATAYVGLVYVQMLFD